MRQTYHHSPACKQESPPLNYSRAGLWPLTSACAGRVNDAKDQDDEWLPLPPASDLEQAWQEA